MERSKGCITQGNGYGWKEKQILSTPALTLTLFGLLLSDEVGETEESINQSINGACCHLLFVVRPDDLDLVRLEWSLEDGDDGPEGGTDLAEAGTHQVKVGLNLVDA